MIITTSHLCARIGETPQECAARYGEPIKTLQEDMLLYQKAGLGVIVTFYKGRADAIAYRKIAENALGKGERISDNEIEFLLKSNSGDTPWTKRSVISMNREWESENSNLFATYITLEKSTYGCDTGLPCKRESQEECPRRQKSGWILDHMPNNAIHSTPPSRALRLRQPLVGVG